MNKINRALLSLFGCYFWAKRDKIWKKGRKEGRKEVWKEGRKKGRKMGRKERRKKGIKERKKKE